MTMINLTEVGDGDFVIIQDLKKNVASGTVEHRITEQTETLSVQVFGVGVPFATRRSSNHRWKPIRDCRVVGHTPLLIGGGQ